MSEKSVFYPLAKDSHDKAERDAMERVIRSGRLTVPSGNIVHEFEDAFAEKIKAPYAVMVNSGSSANLVAVASLFFKKDRPLRGRQVVDKKVICEGDEVIAPALSWATTFTPLQQYGLKVKFVDIDLHTLNIDISKLEAALTPRTRMVVAVSILGNPAPLEELRAFCDKHKLYLFEDNCESLGAEINGKPCGTFGDVGTFSFFYSHHLSTGEGGMLVTASAELADIARSLSAHGWTRNLPKGSSIYQRKWNDRFEAYRFILPGYNLRPQEVNGAAGLEQLKKLDSLIAWRRRNAEIFTRLFGKDERFIIQQEHGKSSWFDFAVILNPEAKIDREKVFAGLKDAGIEFRIVTGGNVLRHDMIKYFDYEVVGGTPNADTAHDWGFFVGNFGEDITAEINYFHKTLIHLV